MPDPKADKAADAPTKPADAPAAPSKSVVMEANYGFYEDSGRFRSWKEGEVVTDPAEVKLLLDRGAPVKAAA